MRKTVSKKAIVAVVVLSIVVVGLVFAGLSGRFCQVCGENEPIHAL